MIGKDCEYLICFIFLFPFYTVLNGTPTTSVLKERQERRLHPTQYTKCTHTRHTFLYILTMLAILTNDMYVQLTFESCELNGLIAPSVIKPTQRTNLNLNGYYRKYSCCNSRNLVKYKIQIVYNLNLSFLFLRRCSSCSWFSCFNSDARMQHVSIVSMVLLNMSLPKKG